MEADEFPEPLPKDYSEKYGSFLTTSFTAEDLTACRTGGVSANPASNTSFTLAGEVLHWFAMGLVSLFGLGASFTLAGE